MSAVIVRKNSATTTATTTKASLYFGYGDIFNLNNSNDKSESDLLTIGTRLAMLEKDCAIDSMEQQKDQLEKPKESGNGNYQYRFHNALTRTVSQPQQPLSSQQCSNVASLVTPLIENFGNINLHRKLERTQSEPLPQQVNTSRYKTELCRPFEEAGECKYGEKCQFAHGYHELRNLQRHPKYKTEYCRTFHSVGFCPYGPRCHFVHNIDEARASQQQQQQQQMPQQTKIQIVGGAQQQPQQQQQQLTNVINLGLPLSPPLSMSTGSDRESPTGSLSLSPANSMTNFPFGDQTNSAISNNTSVFPTTFSSYVNTPPESPNAPISPVNTPPPSLALNNNSLVAGPQVASSSSHQLQYIKPTLVQGKQVLQKSSSSPIAIATNVGSKSLYKMNSVSSVSSLGSGDETRLPLFNRLGSTIENGSNMVLL